MSDEEPRPAARASPADARRLLDEHVPSAASPADDGPMQLENRVADEIIALGVAQRLGLAAEATVSSGVGAAALGS